MELSDNKESVTLSISGNLSTTEVETLIADLSVVRANMQPAVPFAQPKPEDLNDDSANISCQDDPRLSVRLLHDGRIRLWLRNAGLGWMIFNLPINVACTIRDYLVANTPKTSDGSNLFSKDFGGSDTTQ